MQAKLVIYERVVNLGNYETERLGIHVEPTEGEGTTVQELFDAAVDFIEKQLPDAKKRRTRPPEPVDLAY